MPPLSQSSRTAVRAWARHHSLPNPYCSRVPNTASASSVTTTTHRRHQHQQQRQQYQRRSQTTSSVNPKDPTFNSPLPTTDHPTTAIPSFKKYMSKSGETSNKTFSYFMVGAYGLLTGWAAKNTVGDFLANMSASADVLAQAKVEVDLASIPEGKNVIIKWRGKPVFIRHRTASEISEAQSVDISKLRDPQSDADRTQKPEWLIMLGVCTHLGCVPIGEAGDYGGWFCPCHGSHYDISGRVRKGPAPLNLEVPGYEFPSEEALVIG